MQGTVGQKKGQHSTPVGEGRNACKCGSRARGRCLGLCCLQGGVPSSRGVQNWLLDAARTANSELLTKTIPGMG
jgi:hypothetical protein